MYLGGAKLRQGVSRVDQLAFIGSALAALGAAASNIQSGCATTLGLSNVNVAMLPRLKRNRRQSKQTALSSTILCSSDCEPEYF
jgi:hypothetical protein